MSLEEQSHKKDLRSLETGLHIISCPASKDVGGQDVPVQHYGILDVGNTAELSPDNAALPILIHQTPPEIDTVPFDFSDDWEYVETISGVDGARIRLQKALKNHEYNPLFNNCEQFVNYIKSGRKQSDQIEAVATVAAVIGTGFVGYKLIRGAGRLLGKLFKAG